MGRSLSVMYAQITAATLSLAVNDAGSLGIFTKALLALQQVTAGDRQVLYMQASKSQNTLACKTQHLHLLRPLCLLKDVNIAM